MRYRYKADGADIGAAIGFVGAAVATIWGGYELGSAINDALHITSPVGRGALDLVVMCVVARPAFGLGFYGGMVTGKAIGAISHPIIEKTKDIGELVLKGYKKIRGKETDKSNDEYVNYVH